LSNIEKAASPDLISILVEAGGKPDELLASVLNALPDAIFVCGGDGRPVFANHAAANYAGPNHSGLMTPERLLINRALAGDIVDREAHLVQRPLKAEPFWVECRAQPLRGADGSVCGAVLVIRDIDERKRSDLALESEDQLRDFIQRGNLAGILRTTFDGRIIDCNDALVRMMGYPSKEALMAQKAQQLYYDPKDRDRMFRLLGLSRQLDEFEVCFRRQDGSRCWALLNVRHLDAQRGDAGGNFVSVIMDITERKLWEETLRQSEQRFATFMRHLPGVAFIKDLSGRYVYHNEACRTLFGKGPEDIVGKTDEELWAPEDAAVYKRGDATVIETHRPVEVIESVPHLDGRHTWLVYKFPIIEDDEIVLVGSIGIDVTERQTLEDQLAKARKMEALGRLAGGVAHDFNNLLTVICGYGQLALEGIGSTPTSRLTIYLQEILNSARRAAGLTGQLLAFSRRQAVEPKVLDIGNLLHNLERLLERTIGEHVTLKIRTSHEACLVRADAHQMEQVLMNLAVNSRDAMPLGGELDIECGLLPQAIERAGQEPLRVFIEVRDTGIGMDESVKAQMFEPFFTSKDKGKGTGLGLSTVYGAVTQAGGEIEVESQPGEGSRFRLYFPLAKATPDNSPTARAGIAPVGFETVLLVEDEASLRTLAETILKRLGYSVLVADSGQKALEVWEERQGSIDVLLTDVIMPQMSGGELAHKLLAANPKLKILFMSGYTDDMILSHGALVGEKQLIQKPFTAEALGRKLRAVLDA
jgi:two-component system cell cycle sensor histidine kinase/response regulator CckA